MLCYFFNPVLTSLRGIQQASTIEVVQKKLGIKLTSLGALSEASQVFDTELLYPLIKKLAARAIPYEKDPRLKALQQNLIAVDGTLLSALPRMLWALWLDEQNRAAKLHLALDIENHVPVEARITHGNASEKMIARDFLKSGALYVFDAGYAEYKFIQDVISAGSSVIMRIKDNAVWDEISSNPLPKAAKDAGVTKDIVVRLGSKSKQNDIDEPVRIIEVFHKGDETIRRKSRVSSKKTYRTTDTDYTFLLVTDRMDLPAEVIVLYYRYRWQIEIFFRWFKCILGCQHLLAHSENGGNHPDLLCPYCQYAHYHLDRSQTYEANI